MARVRIGQLIVGRRGVPLQPFGPGFVHRKKRRRRRTPEDRAEREAARQREFVGKERAAERGAAVVTAGVRGGRKVTKAMIEAARGRAAERKETPGARDIRRIKEKTERSRLLREREMKQKARMARKRRPGRIPRVTIQPEPGGRVFKFKGKAVGERAARTPAEAEERRAFLAASKQAIAADKPRRTAEMAAGRRGRARPVTQAEVDQFGIPAGTFIPPGPAGAAMLREFRVLSRAGHPAAEALRLSRKTRVEGGPGVAAKPSAPPEGVEGRDALTAALGEAAPPAPKEAVRPTAPRAPAARQDEMEFFENARTRLRADLTRSATQVLGVDDAARLREIEARMFGGQEPARAIGAGAPEGQVPTPAVTGELGTLARPGGGVSTELSVTVTDPRLNNGQPTNIPLLVEGQQGIESLLQGTQPTPQQQDFAIQRAAERVGAGAQLPSFGTIDEAVSAARQRSVAQPGQPPPVTAQPQVAPTPITPSPTVTPQVAAPGQPLPDAPLPDARLPDAPLPAAPVAPALPPAPTVTPSAPMAAPAAPLSTAIMAPPGADLETRRAFAMRRIGERELQLENLPVAQVNEMLQREFRDEIREFPELGARLTDTGAMPFVAGTPTTPAQAAIPPRFAFSGRVGLDPTQRPEQFGVQAPDAAGLGGAIVPAVPLSPEARAAIVESRARAGLIGAQTATERLLAAGGGVAPPGTAVGLETLKIPTVAEATVSMLRSPGALITGGGFQPNREFLARAQQILTAFESLLEQTDATAPGQRVGISRRIMVRPNFQNLPALIVKLRENGRATEAAILEQFRQRVLQVAGQAPAVAPPTTAQ